MRLTYYIPNREALQQCDLAELGLADLLATTWTVRQADAGPDGQRGILVADHDESHPPTLDDSIEWHKHCDHDWYVGVDRNAPPMPEELHRGTPLETRPVTLGDDNEWLIPVATFGETPRVPRIVRLNESGEVVTESSPRFSRELEIAARIFDGLTDESAEVITDSEAIRLAAEIIGLNYRVDLYICGVLGILRTDVILPVLNTFTDLTTIMELAVRSGEQE